MTRDEGLIFEELRSLLMSTLPRLKVSTQTEKRIDVCGKKKVTVWKKEIDGMYFGSAVIQKNFIGFYFFPIYTHPQEFANLPEDLRKCFKGKSCIHIKQLDPELLKHLRSMVKKGMSIYRKAGWI